jgi:charged multivesicular body protein 7
MKLKPLAMAHLRTRKQLEDLLTKRLNSLGILESTLIRVDAAAGDVEVWPVIHSCANLLIMHLQIMKSYESSTATLRAILAHPSLQRDHIEETMEAMAEANSEAKDVDEAIRINGNVALGVEEDDDLEEELKALVGEAEGEKLEAEKLEGMNVPEGAPAMPDEVKAQVAEYA